MNSHLILRLSVFLLSDELSHSKRGVRIDRPFRSYFSRYDCTDIRIPTWILQKSSIKTGAWYNRTVPHTAHKPTIIPLDNPSGIFLWGTHIRQPTLHHHINFEHLVFYQMLFFMYFLQAYEAQNRKNGA